LLRRRFDLVFGQDPAEVQAVGLQKAMEKMLKTAATALGMIEWHEGPSLTIFARPIKEGPSAKSIGKEGLRRKSDRIERPRKQQPPGRRVRRAPPPEQKQLEVPFGAEPLFPLPFAPKG
jgi:hypothetical protein